MMIIFVVCVIFIIIMAAWLWWEPLDPSMVGGKEDFAQMTAHPEIIGQVFFWMFIGIVVLVLALLVINWTQHSTKRRLESPEGVADAEANNAAWHREWNEGVSKYNQFLQEHPEKEPKQEDDGPRGYDAYN